eukprot:1180798-Prorocentrum_minimum.AAC.1
MVVPGFPQLHFQSLSVTINGLRAPPLREGGSPRGGRRGEGSGRSDQTCDASESGGRFEPVDRGHGDDCD